MVYLYATVIAIIIIALAIAILPLSIKIIQQWQLGVVFFLGKYRKVMKPGLRFIIPYFEI